MTYWELGAKVDLLLFKNTLALSVPAFLRCSFWGCSGKEPQVQQPSLVCCPVSCSRSSLMNWHQDFMAIIPFCTRLIQTERENMKFPFTSAWACRLPLRCSL